MGAWFEYFTGIVMSLMALLWLFEGSRRLILNGIRKDAIQMLVVGVFLSLTISGISYFKHRMVADAIHILKQPVIAKHLPLPDDWGANCCEATREANSRGLVQSAFIESGKLYDYIDSSGKRTPFAPSEKDIREREERVVSNARLEDLSRDRLSDALSTLVAMILAALIGAGAGYEQRRSSANNTAESDAPKSDARGSP